MLMRLSILLLLVHWNISDAAEIFYTKMAPGVYTIRLEGEIRSGDYGKLVKLIKENPATYLATNSITLSSRGGSVLEAMKIGEFIEGTAFVASVDRDETCASACFFIFIAGSMRLMDGSVLIHRPYVQGDSYDSSQLREQGDAQRKVGLEVRNYLTERSVSGEIIDKMMRVSSANAYEISFDDLVIIGIVSPAFEEAAIAKCGVSSSEMLEMKHLAQEKIKCVVGLREESKYRVLVESIGNKRAYAAAREFARERGVEIE